MKSLFKKFTRIYQASSYYLFRQFYTLNHCLMLLKMKLFKPKHSDREKKYIILCGAELNSPRSSAMIFSAIALIKQVHPQLKPVVFSMLNYPASKEEKNSYNFKIIHWVFHSRARLISRGNRLFFRKLPQEQEIRHIAEQTLCMLDLGNFQLSSKRGTGWSANCLSNVAFSKRFNLPYYFFPQYFGPFNYPIKMRFNFWLFLKLALPVPKKIFFLDPDSKKHLSKHTESNLEQSCDFILAGHELEDNAIYKNPSSLSPLNIKQGAIAVIPGSQLLDYSSFDQLLEFYSELISGLSALNPFIYIIPYTASSDDLRLCTTLKSRFRRASNIELIEARLNAFELEKVTAQFALLISSKYYATLAAHKKGVPVVAISRTKKTRELMKKLGQQRCFFQYSDELMAEEPLAAASHLLEHSEQELAIIAKEINAIQRQHRPQFTQALTLAHEQR
ncbi:hypothetical protein SAMN02745866_00298 [Alteromonadaceae bacterium Bs31]|nr:hypothetical protein SAMN02745866_00298 [Alteromonadaceae bacterium Bs31]